MAGPTQGLVLTPARWSTWVGQRHEWNGYLWIRWSDAEAVLLFVSGRPRIHLWEAGGWAEGEHALKTVTQRLDRLPPPRWGQVALPARWAAAMRDLSLMHPALPTELVAPEEWIAWARRTGFTGLAVLIGDVAAAWIALDGNVRGLRFQQGVVAADDGGAGGTLAADGVLQIYRGRVAVDLTPVLEVPVPSERPVVAGAEQPPAEVTAAPTSTESAPVHSPEPVPASAPPAVPAAEAPPPPEPAVTPAAPLTPSMPATVPDGAAASSVPIPAADVSTAAAQISPPAPAESGETTVVSARSEMARRFRGDERFLLAPTVDLANPETLLDVMTEHGEDILGWLPLLDGGHTLEEVARAGLVPLSVVDAVVATLADRRMVFRYTARPRTPSRSP